MQTQFRFSWKALLTFTTRNPMLNSVNKKLTSIEKNWLHCLQNSSQILPEILSMTNWILGKFFPSRAPRENLPQIQEKTLSWNKTVLHIIKKTPRTCFANSLFPLLWGLMGVRHSQKYVNIYWINLSEKRGFIRLVFLLNSVADHYIFLHSAQFIDEGKICMSKNFFLCIHVTIIQNSFPSFPVNLNFTSNHFMSSFTDLNAFPWWLTFVHPPCPLVFFLIHL